MLNTSKLMAWARRTTLLVSAVAALYSTTLWAAGPLGSSPETTPPLGVIQAGKPMVMLVAGRDHKLFYEAYNDASDIDGDGTLDTRFKPSITYFGLFDSKLCYTHNGKSDNDGLFTPVGTAGTNGKCPGQWAGNWLNYMTTSRIDALRKVLYGGHREVDNTTQTILRRAYIPHDSHSWGKEYHSSHGYLISDYTPLAQPSDNTKRHFFGNLTANRIKSCAKLNDCSNMPPLLRIRENVTNKRIWEWASKERPVLHDTLSSGTFPSGTGSEKNYTIRALVCTSDYNEGCKRYPNGQYKPTGVLHDYGETDAMLFGLLTGSYDKHLSGGRLRKVVSSFSTEVTASTGVFASDAKIVNTFNNLRIRGFNQSSASSEYWKSSPYTDSAKAPTEGQLVDWGNPIGEMLYEATRYFAGKKTATSAFTSGTTIDAAVGLNTVAWDDPYESTSAAKAPWCAKASFLAISDINPSFDSDSVPGSVFNAYSGDITGLNAATVASTITSNETGITGNRFIGQSGTGTGAYDAAPTAKNVTSLGSVRGLAPEEPTKQGSYYAASVAHFAKTTDIRPTLEGTQTLDTYVVALSSPLPRIEAKLPNGKVVTLVPFAKTVAGSGVSATKGNYQPTNQIVDFYVETLVNSGAENADPTVNGGRYFARFLINYEDVEQGGDHDMDAIAEYTVQANADNTLSVTVRPTYQAGGMQQNMGYVISGTTKDGVYLVARDESSSPAYFLNVPHGRDPGYCDASPSPTGCNALPSIGDTVNAYVFTPSSTAVATLLKDPLWYAAKWGGFNDRNANNKPDQQTEWDADKNGVPDTYFLVQNPVKLRDSLRKAFDSIYERSAAAGNVAANSSSISTDTAVFQSTFNSGTWTGDLASFPVTSTGVGVLASWKASEKMPSFSSRRIVAVSGGNGVLFSPGSLTATDKLLFGIDLTAQTRLIDYLRGQRDQEVQNGGTLRSRGTSVIGDIVHSSPYFLKDNNTVFVGSNSGMLHAFNASTGVEQFAFVPGPMLAKMPAQADPEYKHAYGVDGEIAISDKAKTGNVNYLVGFLGHGGKGLFALDVTSPSTFGTSNYKWANYGTSDNDMGYLLGRPVMAKTKDGSNVVIFGNGYNSTSGRAALYVYKLETGALLAKIDTLVGSSSDPNGLASPGLTYASDGTVEHVYAGDLKGNVWKFNLTNSSPSEWKSAFLSGSTPQPFFTATDSGGKAQPITAQITVAVNDVNADANFGKRFLLFGTGSYMSVGDPANVDVQSLYGLIDDGSRITSKTTLTQRQVLSAGTFAGRTVRTFSTASANDMSGKSGWYLNWLTPPSNTPEGERVVSSARIYKAIKPVLVVSSIVPVDNPCVPGGRGYVNGLDPYTGAALNEGVFDLDGDSSFANDKLGATFIGSFDLDVGLPGEPVLVGNRLVVGGSQAKISDVKINLPSGGGFKGRISWREIVR